MRKRLLILALEDGAAMVHVLAMFLHEAAQEIKRADRKPRAKRAQYEPWMKEANIVRRS